METHLHYTLSGGLTNTVRLAKCGWFVGNTVLDPTKVTCKHCLELYYLELVAGVMQS